MKVLITGGAGYIGSHIALEFLSNNIDVVILDNFSNSRIEVINAIEEVSGKSVAVVTGDISDISAVKKCFESGNFNSVIHCAGLKSVDQSINDPLLYYRNNVYGSLNILQAIRDYGVPNVIFSSSATVYGEPEYLPIDESHPTEPRTPYGYTKLTVERIMKDFSYATPGIKSCVLRYFNPIGSHPSKRLRDNPEGVAQNIMPSIIDAASGKTKVFQIFGSNFDTPDGTGVRDYIHIQDVARAHFRVFEGSQSCSQFEIFNLGVGRGYSVLELLSVMSEVVGYQIPFVRADRRSGDVASCFASATKLKERLNWEAKLDLRSMCESAWASRVD